MASRLTEIMESGLGPNLWANRIARMLGHYRTTSEVDLAVSKHNMKVYDSVDFMYEGRAFRVTVREL